MKNALSRSTVRTALLACGLVAAMLWSAWQLRTSRATARTALANLHECELLAQQITKLERRPSRAVLRAKSSTELAQRIEQAARAAKLPADRIVRIDPQPSRRVGDTAYKEQHTRVEMRLVTLKALIIFLDAVTGTGTGLEVSSLRISAPRRETADGQQRETWLAEMTLTHSIFAPKS